MTLIVDFTTLEDSSKTLSTLHDEFKSIKGHVNGLDDHWGYGRIKDAMHEFSGNWDYRRELLTEKIEETGKKVDTTIDAFRKADQKLYNELMKSYEDKKHG